MPWHNYSEIRKGRNQAKFYTSMSFKIPDRRMIIKYLRSARRAAWVSPEKNGFVCVFDELWERLNIAEIHKLGTALTKQLQCHAFAIIKQEHNLIWYQLYETGTVVGQTRAISETPVDIGLEAPQADEIRVACEVSDVRYAGAEPDRVKTSDDLVELLDLPLIASCLSFEHIEADNFEMEFEDLASEDMLEFSWDQQSEIVRHNSLKKMGWTKVAFQRAAENRTGSTDAPLFWPGFEAAASPVNEQDVDAFLSRGTECLIKRIFNDAIRDFDQVLSMTSEFPYGYYGRHNRALAKLHLGDKEGAIDDLLVAVKLYAECDTTRALLSALLTSSD